MFIKWQSFVSLHSREEPNVSTRIVFSRNKDFIPKVFKTIHKKKKATSGKYCKTITTTTTSKSMALRDSQISMSADASFPLVPKWILMNFPCNTHTHTHHHMTRHRVASVEASKLTSPLLHSRSETSCRCGWFWRCRTPPWLDWLR